MLYNEIKRLRGCQPLKHKNYSQLFLLSIPKDEDHTNWLVGPYKSMTPLATRLRDDPELRDLLWDNRVRLGLRKTDAPPADIDPQKRYGPTVRGTSYNQNFVQARVNPVATPVQVLTPAPVNRRTDREANVKGFWDSLTPQSHHIVEFNNLETLGVSHENGIGEMDYDNLPAVLLAAEFHQRYISAVLKPAQHWGKAALQTGMVTLYRDLYQKRSPLFEPLWRVSKVILTEARLPA
jgi:hypothetical protein